jgi:hypothetical protein
LHIDPDLRLNDPVNGSEYSAFGMQKLWFWWQGAGKDDGSTDKYDWSVK